MYAQRKDNNEKVIIDGLRACGVYVQQMDRLAGFDLLLAFRGVIHIVEIKNPDRSTKLTDAEHLTAQMISLAGCEYNIVSTLDEALKVVELL